MKTESIEKKKARRTGLISSGRTELKTPHGNIFQLLSPILYLNYK